MAKLSARKNAVFLAISTLIAGIIVITSSPIFIVEAYTDFEKKLDYYGVPFVYYDKIFDGKTIGFQRNPVTTALQANEYYDMYKVNNNESSKTYFLNNVNWLVK